MEELRKICFCKKRAEPGKMPATFLHRPGSWGMNSFCKALLIVFLLGVALLLLPGTVPLFGLGIPCVAGLVAFGLGALVAGAVACLVVLALLLPVLLPVLLVAGLIALIAKLASGPKHPTAVAS
jgi:hypothetical protein